MKVLICHHVEPMWATSLNRLVGVDLYDYANEIIQHIMSGNYDRVILTQFEDWKAQDFHHETGLSNFVHEWHEYAYGWESGESDDPNEFCAGGNHSEIVWTPAWIRALKGNKVSLLGCFDGECIEDMEIALTACEVNYSRVNELIY